MGPYSSNKFRYYRKYPNKALAIILNKCASIDLIQEDSLDGDVMALVVRIKISSEDGSGFWVHGLPDFEAVPAHSMASDSAE